MTSPVHVYCIRASNTKAWFRNVNVGDGFCNLCHAPESTSTTIVKQDQWICVNFFFCRAPMVYPGFVFSICVIKDFGDFPKNGQKVTKFVPRISLLLSPKFLVFPFWKRKQPIFLDYEFNNFCLQRSLMIILLLSVPEFYITSSNGSHGEYIYAKNTCPKNSS
jgi:hypothetical protein